MDERLFKVVLTIIPVLCTILTVYIIPLIKAKIGNEKLAKYEDWALKCVRAAEMIFVGSGRGVEKKQYVIKFLDKLFNAKKTVITDDQMEILIEAALKTMKEAEGKNES